MRQAHGPMSHKILTLKQDSAMPLNYKHTFFWGYSVIISTKVIYKIHTIYRRTIIISNSFNFHLI